MATKVSNRVLGLPKTNPCNVVKACEMFVDAMVSESSESIRRHAPFFFCQVCCSPAAVAKFLVVLCNKFNTFASLQLSQCERLRAGVGHVLR